MKKNSQLVYLIGDFRAATVFVGEGLLFSQSVDPKDFEKPFHDVELRGRTYRFWNAEERLHRALGERPNTFIFSGDLSGMLIQIDNEGTVSAQHVPALIREPD
ncbi:MAG: hypothetical protein KDI65_07260 [Alphaproteobacteria bacterium]|nr:hypothetical protein [Alphaproteobacteria bacterium]